MALRRLLCSLIVLIVPLITLADTLVVAGHARQLTTPLVVEGGEVLAPMVPSMRLLGASANVRGQDITITRPGEKSFRMTLNSTAATVDGRTRHLPIAPREQDGDVYLPVHELAPWLEVDVRYTADTKTLAIYPLVAVTYKAADDGVALLVRCAAPIQYTSGRMTDPPRLFFDFKNASLGMAEQQMPVGLGAVDRLRLSQYSVAPDVVRMVVDLSAAGYFTTSFDERGQLATITIHAGAPASSPAPPSPGASPLSPAKLTGIAITRESAQLSNLTITADGTLTVDSDYDVKTRQLTLTFANGVNALPAKELREAADRMVTKVEAVSDAATTGAKLVLTLNQDAGYQIHRDGTDVHVLIGTFNINDMVIVLDAGHGGGKPGASGVNGTLEKTINLDVILRTAALLKTAGAKVLLTRQDDQDVGLSERAAIANRNKADIFVSVHCNSSAVPNSGSGSQVWYYTPQSLELARAMHTELIKGTELKDGGIHRDRFVVVREPVAPAVLLEIAFINNEREEKLLNSPTFRQQTAEGIVNGIRRYAAGTQWQLQHSDSTALVVADGGAAGTE